MGKMSLAPEEYFWGPKLVSTVQTQLRFPIRTGVDKTRNMEHPGTSRNIPEHQIIMITMRKICKTKLPKLKLPKINWYQLEIRKDIFGGRWVVGRERIPSTYHNECRLFPPNCITWLYRTPFFNTNVDDFDDECQVIHCVSFVDPWFLRHMRCS